MSVTIEELNEKDDYQTYCQLLKNLTFIDPQQFTVKQFNDRLCQIKTNPNHYIYVAKLANVIVGTATLLIEPKFIHNLSSVGHIEDVVVDPIHQSKGIGKQLLTKCLEKCASHSCYKIILDCNSKNITFYQKCGFVQKEHQMVFYLK